MKDLLVRCPLCGCRLTYLICNYYRDTYLARCFCVSFVTPGRFIAFDIDYEVAYRAMRGGGEVTIPLPKELRGWHGRWMAAGYRDRAQRYQDGLLRANRG